MRKAGTIGLRILLCLLSQTKDREMNENRGGDMG